MCVTANAPHLFFQQNYQKTLHDHCCFLDIQITQQIYKKKQKCTKQNNKSDNQNNYTNCTFHYQQGPWASTRWLKQQAMLVPPEYVRSKMGTRGAHRRVVAEAEHHGCRCCGAVNPPPSHDFSLTYSSHLGHDAQHKSPSVATIHTKPPRLESEITTTSW